MVAQYQKRCFVFDKTRRLVNGKVFKEMSSSKHCKEKKDPQKIDAYDPQMDPDLCDGYKFHKTYETIGNGHQWIRRNNADNPECADNPEWMTHVSGRRVLPGFTVDENESDIHLYMDSLRHYYQVLT